MLVPDDHAEEVITFKNESYATSLQLEADLFDKLTADTGNPDTSFTAATPPIINVTPPTITCSSGTKPLSEWGVRFSGDSKNVYSFIERINELALSRKVSESDLFNSAVELFVGDAFVWYRSVRSSVTDWNSLITRLKIDFLPPDAEDDIWDQIKNRKQRRNETVAIFIAQLENLFSRLPRTPAELTKVKHIRKNLLPEYVSQLALMDIGSVSELSNLCRKLEDAAHIKSRNKVPEVLDIHDSRTSMSLQNISRNQNNTFRKNFSKFKGKNISRNLADAAHAQNQPSTSRADDNIPSSSNANMTKKQVVCWNCNAPNHFYTVCLEKRKRFCYRCGHPNTTVATCPTCSKNQ